jgi:ribonuclease HI
METKVGCESGSAILYYAGVCRREPGKASIGFIICLENDGTILEKFSAYLNDNFKVTSTSTNYKSLICGLQHAISLGIKHLTARGHFHNIGKQVGALSSLEFRINISVNAIYSLYVVCLSRSWVLKQFKNRGRKDYVGEFGNWHPVLTHLNLTISIVKIILEQFPWPRKGSVVLL